MNYLKIKKIDELIIHKYYWKKYKMLCKRLYSCLMLNIVKNKSYNDFTLFLFSIYL